MSDWRAHLGMLPEHMRESVQWWIEDGEPHPRLMGSFLSAVLTNDLVGAFAKADLENAARMGRWAEFLDSFAPTGSHGSAAQLVNWYDARHRVKGTPAGSFSNELPSDSERLLRMTHELAKLREGVVVFLSARTVARLRVLGEPAEVLARLADHAQQGVYRPGSWERPWLVQVFGEDFLAKLEKDPDAPFFQRPKETP